jgi:hypothetical protein
MADSTFVPREQLADLLHPLSNDLNRLITYRIKNSGWRTVKPGTSWTAEELEVAQVRLLHPKYTPKMLLDTEVRAKILSLWRAMRQCYTTEVMEDLIWEVKFARVESGEEYLR